MFLRNGGMEDIVFVDKKTKTFVWNRALQVLLELGGRAAEHLLFPKAAAAWELKWLPKQKQHKSQPKSCPLKDSLLCVIVCPRPCGLERQNRGLTVDLHSSGCSRRLLQFC